MVSDESSRKALALGLGGGGKGGCVEGEREGEMCGFLFPSVGSESFPGFPQTSLLVS